MGLTLIAGSKNDDLPGVDIDRSAGVSGWLHAIPPVRDWIAEQGEDAVIHVVTDDQELPDEWAPHSLSVPVAELVERRWREDLAR